MEFYTEDNKKIFIPDTILNNKVTNGHCGDIYELNSKLYLKIYKNIPITEEAKLNTTLYKILKEIEHPNLGIIIEILFKEQNKFHYTADAYLIKKYLEYYQDFLELPKEYIITNFEKLFELNKICSMKQIRYRDLKRENTLFTKENMVLIDLDFSEIVRDLSYHELLKVNNSKISSLFYNMALDSLKTKHYKLLRENNLYDYVIASKLFPITTNSNKSMKVLTKRLKNYARPIDYINSLKNKT